MISTDFNLPDKDGKMHTLSQFKTKYAVVFFYPKDSTPGCTIESKQFSDLMDDFENADTTLIGISGGDTKSKTKFCEKHNLHILLLTDDGTVGAAYNSYGEKKFMGKTYAGFSRNTFVIDIKKKTILKTYEKVQPIGHAKNVFEFITGLS